MICRLCGSSFPEHFDSCPVCGKKPEGKTLNPNQAVSGLEEPQNARWLALLIDTEGSMGWGRFIARRDRTDKEYRYAYRYHEPYIAIGMSEGESRATVDEGARLMLTTAFTQERKYKEPPHIEIVRFTRVDGTAALGVMEYCLPYFVKYRRMATMCLTLFKHRANPRSEAFQKVITQLLGKYLTAKEANPVLLKMTNDFFEALIKMAEKLAQQYLT